VWRETNPNEGKRSAERKKKRRSEQKRRKSCPVPWWVEPPLGGGVNPGNGKTKALPPKKGGRTPYRASYVHNNSKFWVGEPAKKVTEKHF